MKTKSRNHLTITARLTNDAFSQKPETYARFGIAHNVGSTPVFLNCVFFSNKGKKYEREIPWDKLKKGNMLLFDGSLRPNVRVNQETGEEYKQIDFLVSKISEPELIEDEAPETDDQVSEDQESEEA
jgi:hypothetical protein